MNAPASHARLKRLTANCLALPEVGREISGLHARFHVRTRTFAYYLGPKGWIALCLDVNPVDWNDVRRLLVGSYRLVAPRKLADSCR